MVNITLELELDDWESVKVLMTGVEAQERCKIVRFGLSNAPLCPVCRNQMAYDNDLQAHVCPHVE